MLFFRDQKKAIYSFSLLNIWIDKETKHNNANLF